MLLLLYMFNPICRSLRSLQQASELRNVQKALEVPRTSLGSLSEATSVFDADLLREIVGELMGQLKPLPHDARLEDLKGILTAVDGTILPALPKMVWALWKDEAHRGVKAASFADLSAVGPRQAGASKAELAGRFRSLAMTFLRCRSRNRSV